MASASSYSPRPLRGYEYYLLTDSEDKVPEEEEDGDVAAPFTLGGPKASAPPRTNLLSMLLCCLLCCSVCLFLVILFFPMDLGLWWSLKSPDLNFSMFDSEQLQRISSAETPPPFRGWDLLNTTTRRRRPDCARVLANDKDYIAEMAKQRITYEDPPWLDMDCEEIRRRNYFPGKDQFQEDADFPLAQSRVVFRDYVVLEKELAASYSPHNWYCYSVDSKSTKVFRWRMRELANCVPNVLVSELEHTIDSSGHNITRAHMDCLIMLTVPEKQWEYVALLQNHDVTIKSNSQAVQIYRWLDGANDVEVMRPPGGRVDTRLDWSFKAIHMFRNDTRNVMDTPNGFEPKLIFSKGYSESSLSRKMAEFMLYELDLGETLRRIEAGGFGIDEIMIPTLHASDALQAPGGFTRACIDFHVTHVTRGSIWGGGGCGSHRIRHAICLYGLEDLPLNLAVMPNLFANKLLPEFDFGAMLCWWEEMHRRSYNETREHSLATLDKNYYQQMPHVRFQKVLRELNSKNKGLDKKQIATNYKQTIDHFNCTFDPKRTD